MYSLNRMIIQISFTKYQISISAYEKASKDKKT